MTSTRTATPDTATVTADPTLGSVLLHGAAATVAAAVATAVVAAAGIAAGVSLAVAGGPIPVSGFAVLTVIFCVVGLLIATAVRRFAPRPRAAWVAITLGLTALSLVPDVIADADLSTKLLLMLTHLVAAAIVIPVVARRLPPARRRT